ncbi:MAG TPA: TfoX/Sxy family protein [Alphaproteobacteria bacterium]
MHEGFVAYVLDLLTDWGGVSARRMFRSHGLYRQGAMFGLVSKDVLYLRVDDRNRGDFVAAGSRPFRYQRGPDREIEMGAYMECPPDVIENAEDMVGWATKALSAALAAKAAKRVPPTASRRRS